MVRSLLGKCLLRFPRRAKPLANMMLLDWYLIWTSLLFFNALKALLGWPTLYSRPWCDLAFLKECAGEAGRATQSTNGTLSEAKERGNWQTHSGPCSGLAMASSRTKPNGTTISKCVGTLTLVGKMTRHPIRKALKSMLLLHPDEHMVCLVGFTADAHNRGQRHYVCRVATQ